MYKLPTDDSWLTHFDLTAVVNAALVVNFAGSAARASATIISASSGANILDEVPFGEVVAQDHYRL